MAFCGCFRSNPQHGDNRAKNRNSIRKQPNENELIDGGERVAGGLTGFSEQDEWFERRQKHSRDPRNSTNATKRIDYSGNYETTQNDDSAERAIEDFMRSPRSQVRKSIASSANLQQPASPNVGSRSSNKATPIQSNGLSTAQPSYRKTGVLVSKCYLMLCGRCGKRFSKIMILEMTQDNETQTVFDIQSYFNSTQNHDYECPFCYQKAQIIMSESLLVGDSMQLDYSRTVCAQEKSKIYGASISSTTQAGTSVAPAIGSSQAFSALGVSPNEVKGIKSSEEETEPIYYDDATEGRPQLLYTKFQRLKNSTKLARVVLIDETPVLRQVQQPTAGTQATTRKSENKGTNITQHSSSDGHNDDASGRQGQVNQSQLSGFANGANGVSGRNKPFEKSQSPKALAYYPEEAHTPGDRECKDFNSRIMKHLMKSKMAKNQTFYQTKVVNGDSTFLKRQMSNIVQKSRNRVTSQLRASTDAKLMGAGNAQGLQKSTSDISPMNMSDMKNSALRESRVNNLCDSQNQLDISGRKNVA